MLGHISRLEGRSTKAWQVRIPTGRPRKYRSKMFSDSVYGGKKKARKAAEAYLAENAVEETLYYHPGKGVFRTRDEHGQYYWAASFTHSPTKAHFRPFRDSVYGEAQARRLAVAYRRAWEKAVDAAELDRFFGENYPAQAQWQRRYFRSGSGKSHIQRDELAVWCGRDLREWEETGGPPERTDICRHCRIRLESYLSLGNLLLYYGTIAPEQLEVWDG